MRNLNTTIIVGTLMLIGALPAAGQVSSLASAPAQTGSAATVPSPAGDEPAAGKDPYIQKAQEQMDEWEQKFDQLDSAVGTGKEVSDAAEDALNRAWIEAEATYDELQPAGTEGAPSTRIAFERATQALADAWHKVYPGDK